MDRAVHNLFETFIGESGDDAIDMIDRDAGDVKQPLLPLDPQVLMVGQQEPLLKEDLASCANIAYHGLASSTLFLLQVTSSGLSFLSAAIWSALLAMTSFCQTACEWLPAFQVESEWLVLATMLMVVAWFVYRRRRSSYAAAQVEPVTRSDDASTSGTEQVCKQAEPATERLSSQAEPGSGRGATRCSSPQQVAPPGSSCQERRQATSPRHSRPAAQPVAGRKGAAAGASAGDAGVVAIDVRTHGFPCDGLRVTWTQ